MPWGRVFDVGERGVPQSFIAKLVNITTTTRVENEDIYGWEQAAPLKFRMESRMNQGPFGGSLSINLRRSLRLVGPHPNDHPAEATNTMNNGEIIKCESTTGWWF